MKTSDLIRKLCDEHNISIAELARKMGQSPQNFDKKLKRNTISQSELNQIAVALGVAYEQTFASDNRGDMGKILKDDTLVSKYISDELGLTIQSADVDSETIDDGYVKLDSSAYARISSSLYSMPHYAAEFRAKRMSADTYKVIYNKGLGQLQQSAKNRDRFRANVVAFGMNNDITGQAELEKFKLKVLSPAMAVFDIAAIVTNQYYLARIDSRLVSLENKLDYVQKFLEESKKSDLWANGQFLRDVSSKIYEINHDEQYRLATLTTVQGVRRDALSNVKFYHKIMCNYMEKEFDKNLKDFSDTKDVLRHFYEYFDAYLYSIYVYGFAYVIEVVLSQITDEAFLNKVRDDIQSVIDSFQNDYTRELKLFIDSAKSLNSGTLTEAFSGYTPKFHTYGNFRAGLLFEAMALVANLAATYDKGKKKDHKDEVEKQFQFRQKRIEKSINDLGSPIHVIERLNEMYNKPIELLITGDAVYVKLDASNTEPDSESHDALKERLKKE